MERWVCFLWWGPLQAEIGLVAEGQRGSEAGPKAASSSGVPKGFVCVGAERRETRPVPLPYSVSWRRSQGYSPWQGARAWTERNWRKKDFLCQCIWGRPGVGEQWGLCPQLPGIQPRSRPWAWPGPRG